MKREWERKSRSCDVAQLEPSARVAFDTTLREIDEPLQVLSCLETISTQLRSGLFGKKNKVVYMAAIITPRWFFQVIKDSDKEEPFVVTHYLDKMEISENTMQLAAKLNIEDFGIDVLSTKRGMLQRGSIFLGFERNAESTQFIETLKNTVREANK